MTSLHIADYYVGRPGAGLRDFERAIAWDHKQPRALARLGEAAMREEDAASAEAYLSRAVAANPADSRPLADLTLLAAQHNQPERAEAAALSANALMPVNPAVQQRLALYRVSRDEIEVAVQHLANALVGDVSLRDKFFPLLLQILGTEALRPALAPITDDPGPYRWWDQFVRYAANKGEDVAALSALVVLRESSPSTPLYEFERKSYINRLRKEGMIAEAYLYWVNGLDAESLQYLGYLYDGGFERPIDNSPGFGWFARLPENSGIRAVEAETYGTEGANALRVTFSGKRVPFRHVGQYLFLAPGRFELSGRARPDNLQARRGLQWRVHCTSGAKGVLGESELFVGSGDWRDFRFEVDVPPDCNGQQLRLVSAGYREVDHEITGGIWFDALKLERPP